MKFVRVIEIKEYLKSNGVFDQDSFVELNNE